MRFTALALLFVSPLFLGKAFASDEAEHHTAWKTLKAQKPAKASLIPSELVDKIKLGFGETPVEKAFLSADVYFFDHHHLIDPPIRVTTPLGGGTVNMDAFLPEGKGRFSIRMELNDSAGAKVIPDQVYFVPKISHKKDGRELNCGKFFEVTQVFIKQLSTEAGMETYLTQGIYASLFAGTYVFVKKLEGKILLGNLNLTDERFVHQRCTQITEAPKG